MVERVQWLDLPKELITEIGKRLNTSIDILQFRSVCKSWRCSIPPFNHKSLPRFHLQLPYFHTKLLPEDLHVSATVVQTTLYCLEPPLHQSKSKSKSNPWLVKIQEPESGKLRVLNPVSRFQIKELPNTFPKDLNLSDFPTVELGKSYTFQECCFRYSKNDPGYQTEEYKVVLFPDSALTSVNHCAVLMLSRDGHLFLWKYGDENWNQVSEINCYDDIIVYKSGYYAVDTSGTLSMINLSSNKLIKCTPPILDCGCMKHLVVSCGDLYVVDRYRVGLRYVDNRYGKSMQTFHCTRNHPKLFDFKVYKFDEESGWVEVKSLGDRVLFVGDDFSYFVSTNDFAGCKRNCIYFKDKHCRHCGDNDDDALIGSTTSGIALFNLEDWRIGKLASFPSYSQIFWPPPTWLSLNSCPPPGC